MVECKVYQGRDNAIKLVLTEDGAVINHAAITRLRVELGATAVDSQAHPEWFTLGNAGYVEIRLGTAGLTAMQHSGRLVVYDASHPNGLVWLELEVNVLA